MRLGAKFSSYRSLEGVSSIAQEARMQHPEATTDLTAHGGNRGNVPSDIGSLLRRFLHRPAGTRITLLMGLLRGMLCRHKFDAAQWTIIERGARIHKRNGHIVAGRFARFEGGCQIAVMSSTDNPAHFHIGQFSSVGPQTRINAAQRVEIGERCLISWDCDILDTDFHRIWYNEDGIEVPVSAPVIIGNDVWIGARCIILKGVEIGDNCVIGAGSVVTSNILPNSLAAGNPAKVIRPIAGWSRHA
jgi:acetyltransferase-like isoleucine patch superfamily enzyme